MLSAGVRVDHWQVGAGHLFEQTIATGAALRDERDPNRSGLASDRTRRVRRAAWCGIQRSAPLPISAGECRRSTSCSGRSGAGADATAANSDLILNGSPA